MSKFAFLMVAGCLFALPAFAQSLPVDKDTKLSIGVNVGYADNGYHSDGNIVILPHAFYDNNRFYIEGGEGGAYLYKDSTHHLRLGVTHDGRSFDPEDSPAPLSALDERKSSVLAHASYMLITPVGGFRLKAATDALGEHNGSSVSAAHVSRFKYGNSTIYPSFGVTWHDDKYNQHYYGVSLDESRRTGVPGYTAKADVSPFTAVMVNHKLSDHLSLLGYARAEWLSDTQKDSPMSEGSTNSVVRLGLTYDF